MNSVPCDRCEAVHPGFCDRCAYLMANMARWRMVARLEHLEHCTRRGHCDNHIETVYNKLLGADQ